MRLIGVDEGAFWSQMQGGVEVWADVGNGILKSLVFGFVCAFIAVFVGYECKPTPEGVSRATTTTVVVGSGPIDVNDDQTQTDEGVPALIDVLANDSGAIVTSTLSVTGPAGAACPGPISRSRWPTKPFGWRANTNTAMRLPRATGWTCTYNCSLAGRSKRWNSCRQAARRCSAAMPSIRRSTWA